MWLIWELVFLAILYLQQILGSHPDNLRAVNITSTSAILIWDTSANRNVTGYAVYRYRPGPEVLIDRTTYRVTHYKVSLLRPVTTYCYRIRSYINGNIFTNPSLVQCFTTLQVVSSLRIMLSSNSISVTMTTSRTAAVSWSHCSGANRYYVGYSISGSSLWTTIETFSTSITIPNLLPSTNYQFRVQCGNDTVRSSFTPVSHSTKSDQVPETSQPGVITTSVTATVSWSCTGAKRYFISYRRTADSRNSVTSVAIKMSPTTIRNLLPSTEYEFVIDCESEYGKRKSSPPSTVFTENIQPTILNVSIGSTSATVAWQPIHGNTVVMWYEILVSSDSHWKTNKVVNSNRMYRASNLSPETVYVFQVRAVTSSDGNGPWSEPQVGITLPIIPELVVSFNYNETTVSSISVSWMRPPSTVDLYRLTIQSDITADEVSVVNSAERYTFHDLSPHTDYHITIWAVNKAGSGPVSTVNVTTPRLTDIPDGTTAALATITSLFLVLIATIIGFTSLFAVLKWCGKSGRLRIIITSFIKGRSANDSIEMNFSHLRANLDDFELSDTSNGSQDDYSSIRSIRVVETQSYFKSLTVPPRVPSREYTEDTTTTKSSQFTTMPVYPDSAVFQAQSGWFKPTVTQVMRKKLGYRESDFNTLGPGIFYMFHKSKRKARYIDYAVNLPQTLCGIVNNLYKKERCDLNPLEVELKHFTPSAEQWCVKVWQCDKNDLLLERAKKIIQYQTLKPYGLNRRLKITSKEVWVGFSEWYMESKKKK